MKNKRILVCGAGGFIGSCLVDTLKSEGNTVYGVDLKYPEFDATTADEFVIGDLREQSVCRELFTNRFDEVYQLAADMGGAGYIFTGDNDAVVMHNSATINLNVLEEARKAGAEKMFFSSSACIYPKDNQEDPLDPQCREDTAYPANPDSEYGWEKLFSERLYLAYAKNHGMDVSIGRYHNIFGPGSVWDGGREKAPAALCRKVLNAVDVIEVWGKGDQTRSFLYIDECIEATLKLMRGDFAGPVNIGSEEMISINDLAKMIISISGKNIEIRNIPGPEGVRGRNSNNELIKEKLDWEPSQALVTGIEKTYRWIEAEMKKAERKISEPA